MANCAKCGMEAYHHTGEKMDCPATPQTDVATLVERLRAMYSHRGDGIPTQFVNPDGPEAADAITAQAARIAELTNANACLVNDTVLMGLARDSAEAQRDEAVAAFGLARSMMMRHQGNPTLEGEAFKVIHAALAKLGGAS